MKQIDIKDFTEYDYPAGITMSPDGEHGIIAVVNANAKDNCYDSCLWLYTKADGSVKKLTNGRKERKFLWLDNETVLFASNRDNAYLEKMKNGEDWTCFYKISISGGEAEFAFAVPYSAVKMKKAGSRLVLTIAYDYTKPDFAHMDGEEKLAAMNKWKEEKDYEVFDELPFWANGMGVVNKKRNRLAVYDMETGECEIVSKDYESISDFWVEEDDKILYTSNLYTDIRGRYQGLKMYTLSSKKTEVLVEEKDMCMEYACILNGKVTFFGSYMKDYGVNENKKLYTVENGAVFLLADYDDSVHNSMGCDCKFADGSGFAHDETYLYFISTLRKQSVIRRFDADGNLETLVDCQGSVHTLDIAGGVVYYTAMRGMALTEVYSFDGSKEKKLTSFNDARLSERTISPIEQFTFMCGDMELDGYVIKPVGFDPDKTYPGILSVHGGPRVVFGESFHHEHQVFANAGYFVFYTNPFGSDGRGNEFADITGKHGGIDFEHCMAFTDEVLKRYPQLDEKRLGMMGGSYGGYMANWMVGNTDKFAAYCSQRSISNWISKEMTTDIGYAFDREQLDADPWSNPEKLWHHSPLKYANKAKTPILFIQSDEDYRCWMGDALQMFTAMKYFGVEARMCLFHGENHELSRSGKPSHRVRRMTEMMNWFDKYLKKEA